MIAEGQGHQDLARVEVSTDDGVTWSELAHYSGGGVFGIETFDIPSPEWADVEWEPVSLSLAPHIPDAYTGTASAFPPGDDGWPCFRSGMLALAALASAGAAGGVGDSLAQRLKRKPLQAPGAGA